MTDTQTNITPHPYQASLIPKHSTLRPHCLAKDCLHLWIPACSSPRTLMKPGSSTIPIPADQLDCILNVIGASWTDKTKETYGAGLLVYHVYCDLNGISEQQRAPLSQPILAAFLAGCAGSYSGLALNNYVVGLCAWHILHGLPWNVNNDKLHSLLEGASRLAPPSSKKPKRIPCERDTLLQLLTYFSLDNPHNTAIYASIVTTFYMVSRLGEFTVPSLNKYTASPNLFI
ncbi:hypothetical protein ID866_11829 [Astraeus odoratus]|nr:hypothetical protein ID866_11829 [Astraeus odoratus]